MTKNQARHNRENPDAQAERLFPLTDKRAFTELARRQIHAAKYQREIACDSHTAKQWQLIETIYCYLAADWNLGV